MKKISKVLDFYEKIFGTVALLFMLLLVFYQVVARFILGSQLRWSEEIARYLMLYISFVGIGAGIKYHKHVGVDLFGAMLKPKGKKGLMLVIVMLTMAIMVGFVYYSGTVTIKIMRSGQVSPAAHIPMWIPYATIPVGFLGGILREIEEIIKIITTPADELLKNQQKEKSEISEAT